MDFNFSNMFLPVYKHSATRGHDLSAGANYFRHALQRGAISQKIIFFLSSGSFHAVQRGKNHVTVYRHLKETLSFTSVMAGQAVQPLGYRTRTLSTAEFHRHECFLTLRLLMSHTHTHTHTHIYIYIYIYIYIWSTHS